MLEDLPPSPGVVAPSPSPQPRKSRRCEYSSSVGVTQRVRTSSGRGTASERPGSPYVGPATRSKHPQSSHPQKRHSQMRLPQAVHPQTGNDYSQCTLDRRHGSTTPQIVSVRCDIKQIPSSKRENQTLTEA